MSRPIFSVGVDLGGTWVRLDAVDARGRTIKSLKVTAPKVARLPAFLKTRLRAWKTKPVHLYVGSRGVWTLAERTRLKRALQPLASHVIVMSDVEAAWYGAFGKKGNGTLVIAGTGSIAYARDIAGRSRRAGGLGPPHGDEGSSFWIGKEWLGKRAAQRSVRTVAAQAPAVLRRAKGGHPVARSIIAEAQRHLALIACHAAQGLRFKKKIPLSWGGSLLNNPRFRAGFLKVLHQLDPRFHPLRPTQEPVRVMAQFFS